MTILILDETPQLDKTRGGCVEAKQRRLGIRHVDSGGGRVLGRKLQSNSLPRPRSGAVGLFAGI